MATGSLTAIYARIVLELGSRSDLLTAGNPPTGPIPDAVNDAIKAYAKSRFRFNESQPLNPFNIVTVPNQYIYTVADDARIPLLYKIDYINYLLGSTNNRMDRVTPEEIYLATVNGTAAGPPSSFAYDGDSIVIYPAPNQAFILTVGGYYFYPAPTDVADTTNPWMNAAERLIRSRAKYEIATHVTRNQQMQAAMSPLPGSGGAAEMYFDELRAEANKIRGRGKIRPMSF